jgi:hypothetical protein
MCPKTDKILQVSSEHDFNELALDIFRYQSATNKVYGAFVSSLKKDNSGIDHYTRIPFLPISFFRTHEIVCNVNKGDNIVFTSSTTTSQQPSRHIVTNIKLYEESFIRAFELFYGDPSEMIILALLPNYLERKGSSLVYMFEKLISLTKHPESGFFLNDLDKLINVIRKLKQQNKKVLLIGVTYALLDLAEKGLDLNENFMVMETGGMKGRREEMVKEDLHAVLKARFGVKDIHSEYGMTELLSQAYSKGDGLFECPPWMKILIRDVDDPLSYIGENRTGGINVIDLANVNSCSFISTQDLGRMKNKTQFELMGRFDNSDIRGCNLMIG